MAKIIARDKYPVPDYEFKPVSQDLADKYGMFIGVWTANAGFNGGFGPKAMLIINAVDADGNFNAKYLIGPPGPQTRVQLPARQVSVAGTISRNRINFKTPRATVQATLMMDGDLEMTTHDGTSGQTGNITLKPQWRLIDRAPGNTGSAAPCDSDEARKSDDCKDSGAVKRNATRSVTRSEKGVESTADTPMRRRRAIAARPEAGPERGMWRGGRMRGGVVNSPRFPMCARLASQRGFNMPGPERASFVRNCVWSG